MSKEGAPDPIPAREETPRNIFLGALDQELEGLQRSGRISPEQAEEKRRAATLIETGFSDNPGKDASLFSRAGIANEEEIIDVLSPKPKEASLNLWDKIQERVVELRTKLEGLIAQRYALQVEGSKLIDRFLGSKRTVIDSRKLDPKEILETQTTLRELKVNNLKLIEVLGQEDVVMDEIEKLYKQFEGLPR